jgi:hypothetical protein
MDKPPCVELGKPMNWCARSLREQQVDGRITLPADWWSGWKIIKGTLVGPGGMRFNSRQLSALWRLWNLQSRRHGFAFGPATPTPLERSSGASPVPGLSQLRPGSGRHT